MTPTLRDLGIDQFSVEERLNLIGDIWDSLPRRFEMPDGHREELNRRLADADANPDDAAPWEQVLGRLRGDA